MPNAPAPSATLAAGLAARILHDISGPLSGIASGLDLLADPGSAALREDALALSASGVASALELLEFHRVAFGSRGAPVDAATMRRLASSQFEGGRAKLEWECRCDPLPAPACQAALILVQIAATALAVGGLARATASAAEDQLAVRVDGEGPRAAIRSETLEGLGGQDLSRGLAGHWAPARFLRTVVDAERGALSTESGPDRFSITARFPIR